MCHYFGLYLPHKPSEMIQYFHYGLVWLSLWVRCDTEIASTICGGRSKGNMRSGSGMLSSSVPVALIYAE